MSTENDSAHGSLDPRVEDEIKQRSTGRERPCIQRQPATGRPLRKRPRADAERAQVVEAIPELDGATIDWVSPLREQSYIEYQDGAALAALGLQQHDQVPPRLLAEGGTGLGRARPRQPRRRERCGSWRREEPCRRSLLAQRSSTAKSPASTRKIDDALAATRSWLECASWTSHPERWRGPLYQSANRLAHHDFFRERRGVPARSCILLFLDDPTRKPTERRRLEAGAGESGTRARARSLALDSLRGRLPTGTCATTDRADVLASCYTRGYPPDRRSCSAKRTLSFRRNLELS